MATVEEAIDVLTQLGFPRAQLNERSGLTLLALAALTPTKPWVEASAPLRGVTPMMDFMAEQFGKRYAPNSRETVRRQTIHQFVLRDWYCGTRMIRNDLSTARRRPIRSTASRSTC